MNDLLKCHLTSKSLVFSCCNIDGRLLQKRWYAADTVLPANQTRTLSMTLVSREYVQSYAVFYLH